MSNFSYQLYSSRNFPPLSDTLAMLSKLGYTQVEGYGGLFAGLNDLSALKADLEANNLTMTTGHFGLDMIEESPERVSQIARALGMKAVFVPAIPGNERDKDAPGWADLGIRLAEAGKPLMDAGIRFGWHNHDFEFVDLGGVDLPLDLILGGAPDLALEFDVAWAVVAGEDPYKWITKYSDRLIAAHIKDLAPQGEATDEDGWADVGHGVMDWRALMAALRATPVEYLVMEHDNPNDHERFARRSLAAAEGL